MTMPNLASRPFLNTRPVWFLTVVAGVAAVALAAVNLQLWLQTDRALSSTVERRDQLVAERRALESSLRTDSAALDRIPWKSLERRVNGLNLVLREHAFSWVDLLDDIERVVPREVRITHIEPSIEKGGVSLTFEGVARSREDWLELLSNLVADPEFEEPRPRAETSPEGAASAGYEFALAVRYLPEAGP